MLSLSQWEVDTIEHTVKLLTLVLWCSSLSLDFCLLICLNQWEEQKSELAARRAEASPFQMYDDSTGGIDQRLSSPVRSWFHRRTAIGLTDQLPAYCIRMPWYLSHTHYHWTITCRLTVSTWTQEAYNDCCERETIGHITSSWLSSDQTVRQ